MGHKTKDQALDDLLRGHTRRARDGECRGFDPDLANAYVERRLVAGERADYEGHLAGCAACRKGVLMLSRLAEPPAVKEIAGAARAGWLAAVRASLLALATPRLAFAATAALVLAVSIPLVFFSGNEGTPTSGPASEMARADDQRQAAPSVAPGLADKPAALTSGTGAPATRQSNVAPAAPETKQVAEEKPREEQPAVGYVAQAQPPAPPDPQPKAAEAKEAGAKTDEAARDTAREAGQPPAATPPAPEPPKEADKDKALARIDPREGRRAPDRANGDASMSVLKPPNPAVGSRAERGKTEVVTPDDSRAPETEARSDENRSGIAAGPSRPAARKQRAAERSGATPERRVGNKRFWLLNGVWTDREFSPDKEIASVTVPRHSEVYRQLMEKHKGLQLYFTNFGDGERVIIVYKKTAYRLVPQE